MSLRKVVDDGLPTNNPPLVSRRELVSGIVALIENHQARAPKSAASAARLRRTAAVAARLDAALMKMLPDLRKLKELKVRDTNPTPVDEMLYDHCAVQLWQHLRLQMWLHLRGPSRGRPLAPGVELSKAISRLFGSAGYTQRQCAWLLRHLNSKLNMPGLSLETVKNRARAKKRPGVSPPGETFSMS